MGEKTCRLAVVRKTRFLWSDPQTPFVQMSSNNDENSVMGNSKRDCPPSQQSVEVLYRQTGQRPVDGGE